MRTRSHSAEDDISPDVEQEDEQEEDVPSDPELEPDTQQISYHLSQLSEHCSDTRQHLSGTPEDEDQEPPPSYFPPNAYWTTKEKNLFFHAVSMHSRLRPDLISEEIGSKTLADVCTYIEHLEQGLQQNQGDENGLPSVPRSDFPAAEQVSEEWDAFEDKLADAAVAYEDTARAAAFKAARDKEVDEHKLELRAPYRTKGERSRGRDREGEKQRKSALKAWLQEREVEWKKEDLLNSLDVGTMKAMDMLVRETEEARLTGADNGLDTQGESSKTSQESSTLPPVTSTGPFNSATPQPMDFDEELIDPSLRSSSATTRVPSPQLTSDPPLHTPDILGSTLHDNFNPFESPFPHLEPAPSSSTLAIHEDDTQSLADPSMAPLENGVPLSPAARRRLRKRMYMRRKRAEANGGEVDVSAVRLRPGRKKTKMAEAEDVGESTRHAHASGKTLTYKMRERLGEAGITMEWVREEKLDLFHMAGLRKLMRMYNGLHDVEDSVVSGISVHTVTRLRDEVLRFVIQLVQRSIISREQEIRGKTHTKVWRLAGKQVITAVNVSHALSLMGHGDTSKRPIFERLLEKLGFTEEDFEGSEDEVPDASDTFPKGARRAAGSEGEEPDVPAAADVANSSQAPPHPILKSTSVHRVVFPPYIRIPGASTPASSQSVLAHIPWATSAELDTPDDAPSDSDSDSDEEGLAEELREEDRLDERDRVDEAWAEVDLWRKYGITTRKRPAECQGPRPKKKRRMVKTTEFVPSSDEE